ncbi:VOC family protein [Streptosporangiaceae bacterium NEAU-GS5]|nr:VOC family protein [Streptosporangiaceae bacterium NEAU-GS5]
MTTPGEQGARSVSSEVTVGVDPRTAFTVFTDEIDLWWVRGPINFYDAAKAVGMRCEPGVGGRILELYGDDALELGRITAWEPGELLAWDSSVDDVRVEVRFEPVADGARVVVTATIPAGGADSGGTSWVRVHERGWLRDWIARRDTAPHEPTDRSRFGLALYYTKPAEAAGWLSDAFGFDSPDVFGGDAGHGWIEFRIGNCSVMVFQLHGDREDGRPVTHVPWVFVDDLDAHLARARDHGARILSDITQYGYRSYEAADLEGNRWLFAQARPTM